MTTSLVPASVVTRSFPSVRVSSSKDTSHVALGPPTPEGSHITLTTSAKTVFPNKGLFPGDWDVNTSSGDTIHSITAEKEEMGQVPHRTWFALLLLPG